MFNYCNLLIYIFIDCILFKWKLCLFLDFLKYICILWDKMIRLFRNYQIIYDILRKNHFFQKIWGGLGHQVAPPLPNLMCYIFGSFGTSELLSSLFVLYSILYSQLENNIRKIFKSYNDANV